MSEIGLNKISVNNSTYYEKWISHAIALEHAARLCNCAISIWEAKSNRFIFFKDRPGILGDYEPTLFTAANGVDFFLSHVEPDYLKAVSLMYDRSRWYCLQYLEEAPHSVFQLDALYKKNNNTSVQLLLQSTMVETDGNGSPLLFLNVIYDISNLKKKGTANLVIATPRNSELWNYCFSQQTLNLARHLSEQEKKVLILLNQQKESKEIAVLLNTSSHTIDTHRRSLLRKTNCVNSTALLSYARITGII